MGEILRFSLKVKTIPVVLEGPDGIERNYELRDLNGEGRDIFTSTLHSRAVKDANGKTTRELRDPRGLQQLLLTKSMFDSKTNKNVTEEAINSWPGTVVEELFKVSMELSGLTEQAAEDLGNG